MIELCGVFAGYNKTDVLKNVNAVFKRGEVCTILGANGCGKTTALKTVAGMIPFLGSVKISGEDVSKMKRGEIAKKLAYLTQSRNTPDITAGQLVLHGRFPHLGYPRRYKKADMQIAKSKMEKLGIGELETHSMATLSGGMKQCVYIAMALCQETDFILLDEPCTYLDAANSIKVMKILKGLANEGKGIVTVLHDIPMAMRYSDKIAVMDNGKIKMFDTPTKVYESGMIDEVFKIELGKCEDSYYIK